MTEKLILEIDGPVATITNNNTAKHNAFDDDMDAHLFAIFDELIATPSVRAVIWCGEGKNWSSGRDVAAIGTNVTEMTHHELMTRGHKGDSEDLGTGGTDNRCNRRLGHRRLLPTGLDVRHPHRRGGGRVSCCPK